MSPNSKYNYPKQLSLLKFIWNAERIRKNPIPFHHQFFQEFGDTFSVRLPKNKYILLSRDNDVAEYILQKNQRNYHKSALQTTYLSKYLGNGLLTVNGDFWLKQRRLIQPAFHKQKMNQLVENMNTTIVSELNNLPENTLVNLYPIMNNLAFNVVAKSLFHITSLESKLGRIKTIIEEVQNFLVKEIRLPHKVWWFKLSGQSQKHYNMAMESNAILNEIIDERERSKEVRNDLLDMLLETRYEDNGQPMSREQLIDEIKILFIAGHETSANALTFTLKLLAMHPEVQQKIVDEMVSIEKETSDTIEQLQKMTYTTAVINESMRLYPPAWITDRENVADDTLLDYNIRKGTLIGISFYELHRNPKYWENPNDFIPERFLGEQKKQSMQYFYPFGAGPRMCIGMGFALYEMSLALAYLIKKYHISTDSNRIEFNPLVTLKPIGINVTFTLR